MFRDNLFSFCRPYILNTFIQQYVSDKAQAVILQLVNVSNGPVSIKFQSQHGLPSWFEVTVPAYDKRQIIVPVIDGLIQYSSDGLEVEVLLIGILT